MSVETLAALRRGDLSGTRSLTLRCGLTTFPREILGLADTLESLDLSGNALTTLPDDLGRLRHLRQLFCSGNRFQRLPPSLGDCAALSQVGFRGTGLRELPAESLPPAVRWLTLTDNQLQQLPDALGQRPWLQKLMLAGNQLQQLPASLGQAPRLELLRLAANRFDQLPGWLPELPQLAWLAWSGNPMDPPLSLDDTPLIDPAEVQLGPLLGEGASGRIHAATWQAPGAPAARPVAVKRFKGSMTSDGLPEREMAACLAAGEHPHLIGSLGRLDPPDTGAHGLVMPLLPADWRVLAEPPSAASCSRDVYDPTLRLCAAAMQRLARGVADAAAHLHARGLLHGDLYAHNILWDGTDGQAVLSDFGAASFLPPHDPAVSLALQRLEVRAWGLLLGELMDHCDEPLPDTLRTLQQDCVQPDTCRRPLMHEVCDTLASLPATRC